MKHANEIKLALMILAINVITINLVISTGDAIWPFDQFMTPSTNYTSNQTSQDPFKSELPGEHGESPDGE